MLSRWMRPTTAVVILALATVRSAAGQSDVIIDDVASGAQAAYFALTTTPVGALPSWVAYQLGSGARRGTGVRAHLGYIDEEGDFARRTLAMGVDFFMGAGTIGITGGYHDFACDEDDLEGQFPGGLLDIDCKGGFILGANWVTPLIRSPMGSGATTTFVLGLDVAAGLGTGACWACGSKAAGTRRRVGFRKVFVDEGKTMIGVGVRQLFGPRS